VGTSYGGPAPTTPKIASGQETTGQAFRLPEKNRNESDFEYGFVKVQGKGDKVQALYEGAYGQA
jgi:hypothetical protein